MLGAAGAAAAAWPGVTGCAGAVLTGPSEGTADDNLLSRFMRAPFLLYCAAALFGSGAAVVGVARLTKHFENEPMRAGSFAARTLALLYAMLSGVCSSFTILFCKVPS